MTSKYEPLSSKLSEAELTERVETRAKVWYDAMPEDGSINQDAVRDALSSLTFEGQAVRLYFAESYAALPRTTLDAIMDYEGIKDEDKGKARYNDLEPWYCIWDYWDLSFLSVCYEFEKTEDIEILNANWLSAFKVGLGTVVNLGPILVCLAMPQNKTEFDENVGRRLHNPLGPALVVDEERYFFWRGVKVPEEFIYDPWSVDPTTAYTHENAEIRRAYVEIVGWDHIVKQLPKKEVHKDSFGTLYDVPDINDDDEDSARFVHVVCPSTGREYMLRVDPSTTTAKAGVAATFGLEAQQYQPTLET